MKDELMDVYRLYPETSSWLLTPDLVSVFSFKVCNLSF